MVLIFNVQLIEIAAPSPNTNDQIRVVFGVRLRVEKPLAIQRIDLQLMSAEFDENFYQQRRFLYTHIVSEHAVVQLDRQRTAVYDICHIVFGKRTHDRQQSVRSHIQARRKTGGIRLRSFSAVGSRGTRFAEIHVHTRTARSGAPDTAVTVVFAVQIVRKSVYQAQRDIIDVIVVVPHLRASSQCISYFGKVLEIVVQRL